jgi:hypothetical protein
MKQEKIFTTILGFLQYNTASEWDMQYMGYAWEIVMDLQYKNEY